MIITKTVFLKIEGKNYKPYKLKGYVFNWRDTIEIKIEDLLSNSNVKIIAKCDICGTEIKIGFNKYNKNISRGNFYSCQKCSPLKRKKTCLELFGVDNYVKSEDYIKIQKEYCMEKYGVDNFFKTIEFKDKREQTLLDRYGTIYFQGLDEVMEKRKNTCIKKYGVEKTGYLNKNLTKDFTLFKIYQRNCRNLTNQIRKFIFKNWDGYDYYDNEYIKENLSLHNHNRNYPTIDHKISIYKGFEDNIPESVICIVQKTFVLQKEQ